MKIINGKKKLPSPSYTSSMSDQMDDGDDESTPDELNIDEKDEGEGDEPTSRLYSKKNANPDLSSLRDLVIHAPNLEDSRPSLGRNIANSLVAGATAFATKNPVKGLEIGQQLNDEAGNRKAEQFKQDLGAGKILTEMGDTGANLAQKDVAEQGGEEAQNAALENKKDEFAKEFGLSKDKLNALIENEKAQRAQEGTRISNEKSLGEQRLGLEGSGQAETKRHNQAIEGIAGQKANAPAKIPAMLQNKVAAADDVVMSANRLQSMLNDPKVLAEIGPLIGRANSLEELAGSQNATARKFGLTGRMMADTHANLFGARNSIGAMQHFEKALGFGSGSTHMTPEMAKATLEAVIQKAKDTKESITHSGTPITDDDPLGIR